MEAPARTSPGEHPRARGGTPGPRSRYRQLLPGEEDACLKFEFAPFVMSRAVCSQTDSV